MGALVSIVTPCYNGEAYLDRFFQSILRQTYDDLEIVFVDDGSKDKTREIANFYQCEFEKKGIRFVYFFQENAGQAAALNRGLKHFTGEYLLCVDSDDEISEDFVKKRVLFLENNSEYAYCYGKAIGVSDDAFKKITCVYEKRNKSGKNDFFEDILYVKDVFFSGYMIRTSAFEKVIQDREIYAGPGGQNAQILLPMAWYYGEPGYVEGTVYTYYIRSSSHSHSQNTCEKIIRQLCNYEDILVGTIDKIQDQAAQEYKSEVLKYYARLKFGNAVDTKKPNLIRKYYQKLKQVDCITWHDRMLYLKYASVFSWRKGFEEEDIYINYSLKGMIDDIKRLIKKVVLR